MDFEAETEQPPVTELTAAQRRVLGVLVEKAFTTPEYYPLTLKALTNGCNQKSNRSPVCSYSEDGVLDVLEGLRKLGLAAVVYTETGRTERYRHYMRQRFPFSEPQLAIMIELLLRGRQAMGELRARASRMVPIESLDQLRTELRGLKDLGFVQTNRPLERRGVEVDHNLYLPNEGRDLAEQRVDAQAVATPSAQQAVRSEPATSATSGAPTAELAERLRALETTTAQQSVEFQSTREEIESLKDTIRQLADQFDDLRRDLGG